MTENIVVQKYGGTSLGDPRLLLQCAKNIRGACEEGNKPVVVVSAMGRKGDPYATDTFLGLAYSITPNPAPRELDLLMACGELISATLLAVQLRHLGCPASALTGSQATIVTNDRHGEAEIQQIRPERILELVEQGIVPVICGFQGVTERGEITTLGRGGSDITAVAVAAALNIDRATIFTDVTTVKTADPKLVESALPIYKMHYKEVLEMAVEGARVIHPRAVEQAMVDDIKLIITSLTNGNSPPTEIGPRGIACNNGVVRAITHITDRCQFQVKLEPELLLSLLESVGKNEVNLDLVSLSEFQHSFTVAQEKGGDIEHLLTQHRVIFKRVDNCAKIALIGNGIRGRPELMAKIMRPLVKNNIPVLSTSDSYTQIAVLVPQQRLKDALNCLHRTFFQDGSDDDG